MAKISVPEEQQSKPNEQEPNAVAASLAHWSFLMSFIPFAPLIVPLALYFTTGEKDRFVKENAKEALNLFIFAVIIVLVSIPLCFVVIGFFIIGVMALFCLIMPIIAAIQTMSAEIGSEPYRYPIIFRIIS